MIRSYSELITIPSFEERFEYLKLEPQETLEGLRKFRYLNQRFYQSAPWKRVRRQVILRDNGLDLGVEGHDIIGKIYVHHMNPVTLRHLETNSYLLLDMDNLISCSYDTHEAITYSNPQSLPKPFIEREPGDTTLWCRKEIQ